jgi:hypothetical protein
MLMTRLVFCGEAMSTVLMRWRCERQTMNGPRIEVAARMLAGP